MWSAFRPAYLRYTREAYGLAPARDDEGDDDAHDCGGDCGKPCCTGSAPRPRAQTAGGLWSRRERTAAGLTDITTANAETYIPSDAELAQLGISRIEWDIMSGPERLALARRVAGGGGGSVGGGGGGVGGDGIDRVPLDWASRTPEQQRAWLREYGQRNGLTPAEQAALEERAAAADRALVAGIINQGVGVLRTWLTTRSAERIAEIVAAARVEVARIQARAQGQGPLPGQPGYVPPGGYPPGYPYPYPPPAPSGGGIAEVAIPLGLIWMVMKGGM